MTSLLLPTLGRYLRWARSAAPFRLNAPLGRGVGAMRFHMNGGHVPKPLLRPGQFIKMVFLNAQLFRRCLIIAEQLNVLVMGSDKYSIQQKASVASIAANHTSVVDIVPATTTEGMRKVKHLTCNLTQVVAGGSSAESNPSGRSCMSSGDNCRVTQHRNCRATPSSMYEPNQFVMNCGVIDPTAGPIRIYSPISRNLNDGDKISLSSVLLLMEWLQLSLCVRYAITLN